MAKSPDQKLKLTYLIRFFERNTDEEHHATMNDILADLERCGIQAERKAIYDDLIALERLGYEIIRDGSRNSEYYLVDRDFELAELKLLVDAVQSSKFISQKRTEELIRKLEEQTSHYRAVQLQRQVYNTNRVKTINETVLYTIDSLHEAISANKRIAFHYCEWNLQKELVYKNDGKIYQVDPVALIWDDENYYLVAYESDESRKPSEYTDEDIRHYRVDKIRDLEVLSDRRICAQAIANFHPAEYVKEHFNMFAGQAEYVKLRFKKHLIGVLIDRFGKEVTILPDETDEGYAVARVRVQVSNQFFGWMTGFGGDIVLQSPENVVNEYKEFLANIQTNYEG